MKNNLKTLKDLETDSADLFTNLAVASDTLKAEAVKWYKWLEKNDPEMYVCEFIDKFYNLTEEDLKEGEE